jgi:hypothetical protein
MVRVEQVNQPRAVSRAAHSRIVHTQLSAATQNAHAGLFPSPPAAPASLSVEDEAAVALGVQLATMRKQKQAVLAGRPGSGRSRTGTAARMCAVVLPAVPEEAEPGGAARWGSSDGEGSVDSDSEKDGEEEGPARPAEPPSEPSEHAPGGTRLENGVQHPQVEGAGLGHAQSEHRHAARLQRHSCSACHPIQLMLQRHAEHCHLLALEQADRGGYASAPLALPLPSPHRRPLACLTLSLLPPLPPLPSGRSARRSCCCPPCPARRASACGWEREGCVSPIASPIARVGTHLVRRHVRALERELEGAGRRALRVGGGGGEGSSPG